MPSVLKDIQYYLMVTTSHQICVSTTHLAVLHLLTRSVQQSD